MYVQVIYEGHKMKVGPHHAICWRSDWWIPLRFRSGGVHNEAFQTFKTTNQISVYDCLRLVTRGPLNDPWSMYWLNMSSSTEQSPGRNYFAGREGGWKRRILEIEFVYGHSWKRRNMFIVWKKEV